MALDEPSQQDSVVNVSDIRVLIDAMSAHYVKGVTVDYVHTAYGDRLKIGGGQGASSCC